MAALDHVEFVRIEAAMSLLGVALYAPEGWAVSSHVRKPDEGFVSINIGQTPWLFSLFYGPERTAEQYLTRERSFVDRKVEVLQHAQIQFRSRQVTRLVIRSEEERGRAYFFDEAGQLEHRPEHVECTFSHQVFLVHRGRNLQIGYKLEESLLAEYQPLVEEALARIDLLDTSEETSGSPPE